MKKTSYSKEEFQAMVNELESQIEAFAKSEEIQDQAQAVLAKSEDESDKADDKKEDKSEDKKEASSEEAPSDKKEEEKKEDAPAEEKKEESDEDSHGYDDEDMEEMHKMYDSMSKGELKAHKASMEKCWMAKCGDMTKPEASVMNKSEEETKSETQSKPAVISKEETDLLKNELENTKKENEELKKNVEGLVSAMNTFVTKRAPVRKAFTNIDIVKKSEEGTEEKPLSKSEITKILTKKASDPSLSSADRTAINEFYLTNGSLEKIQHLIKQ